MTLLTLLKENALKILGAIIGLLAAAFVGHKLAGVAEEADTELEDTAPEESDDADEDDEEEETEEEAEAPAEEETTV